MDDIDAELKSVVAEMEAQIKKRVEERKVALDQRMKNINDNKPEGMEVGIGIDIDVSWKDVEIIFDLPSVTMKDQRIVFGLPEVAVRDRDIIFHTPSVRMVTKKVGQYPEIHGLTVVWKDILIDVPEPFMQEQRIVMGIPEFTMKDQEIILGLPVITMVRNRIVLGLPQFTVRSVDAVVDDMKRDALAAKSEAESGIRTDLKDVGTASQQRIVESVSKVFAGSRNKLVEQRDQALVVFDNLIASLSGSSNDLRGRGATGEMLACVESSLRKAVDDRQELLTKLEDQLASLIGQEQQVIHDMLERLAFRLPEPPAAAAAAGVVSRPLPLGKLPMGALYSIARSPDVRVPLRRLIGTRAA